MLVFMPSIYRLSQMRNKHALARGTKEIGARKQKRNSLNIKDEVR